ncbi:uncharacterized protein LOC129795990 [Lutzomyia longipalpis]|uniref:Deltamethrin resistance protein prag01 domain-containing protein n=1 Tax=Lutzomyia longipalpis TaxID=7200 RepID=A0A1B0GKD8_LUTLO|nr:uncharacterized protein LOC129795990 [Lutzomyia longipalpis]
MLALRSALSRLAARRMGAGARCYHGKNPHTQSTMNDLPTPQGDFFELHAKRQAKYNRALIIGVATFVGTLVVTKESGLLELNFSPPDTYE